MIRLGVKHASVEIGSLTLFAYPKNGALWEKPSILRLRAFPV